MAVNNSSNINATTPLPLAQGGSSASLTASTGGIVYSGASAMAVLSGTATANQALLSGSTASPAWSTATYPATTTINQLLYSSSTNTIVGLATSATAVLTTSSSIPTWSAQLSLALGGTNANITASNGGIVYSTASALALLSGTATAGQIVRSGASTSPTWSTATYPATAGTSGNVLTSDGTNWLSSAATGSGTVNSGTAGQVAYYATSTNAVSGLTTTAAGRSGINATQIPVQQVYTQTGAVATGTTTIPFDDTIPQSSEGDQYMTLSITPTSATNVLVIEVIAALSTSAGQQMSAALFQDSTANALAASMVNSVVASTIPVMVVLRHQMVSGTTSSTTFKIRGGSNSVGTTTFNGSGGARLYGGIMASSIRITEWTP